MWVCSTYLEYNIVFIDPGDLRGLLSAKGIKEFTARVCAHLFLYCVCFLFFSYLVTALIRTMFLPPSFGSGWGDKGFVRVEMTGDQNGPCGMYTYDVAPSFNFYRPPLSILPAVSAPPPAPPPASSPPPSPLPGSGQCHQDPQDCYLAFLFGGRLGASREEFIASICHLSNISRICPCWCAVNQPPSPPSPPMPLAPHPPIPPAPPSLNWQSLACPSDDAKTCGSLAINASILQECGRNTSFRSDCSCTCEV